MNTNSEFLFLSLRPEYAELLLEEVKTVELRRIRPRAPVGTRVLLYAASPQCELVGTCRVADIGEATPDTIWRLHGSQTGIGHKAFRTYFDGTAKAIAITVTDARRFTVPIPLKSLRVEWFDFQPPQSFRYIPENEALMLLRRNNLALTTQTK